jgi:hypothetical protein
MTNYDRALFLSNTTEERAEFLRIVCDCFQFCHYRRDIREVSQPTHHAAVRVYDAAGNVIQTHEHAGDFKEW